MKTKKSLTFQLFCITVGQLRELSKLIIKKLGYYMCAVA